MADSLEAQVESAWLELLDCPRKRRYWLTAGGRLRYGDPGKGEAHVDVGYYTRGVSLVQFREDVFEAFGEWKGSVHVR